MTIVIIVAAAERVFRRMSDGRHLASAANRRHSSGQSLCVERSRIKVRQLFPTHHTDNEYVSNSACDMFPTSG